MSKKGKKKTQDKIAAKKAVVLGTEKRSRLPLFVAVIGAVIIAAAAVFYVNQGGSVQSASAVAPSTAASTAVSFPLSLFEDGKARHFEHTDGEFKIRYFILKSSDGILRAALMPAMFAGRRAKAIIRKVITWFVETADVGLPRYVSTRSRVAVIRRL